MTDAALQARHTAEGRAITYWATEAPERLAVASPFGDRTFGELDRREVWAAARRGGYRLTPTVDGDLDVGEPYESALSSTMYANSSTVRCELIVRDPAPPQRAHELVRATNSGRLRATSAIASP